MIMEGSCILVEDILEDIAYTSCVEVSSFRTIKMYTIIASDIRVSINACIKIIRKRVGTNDYLVTVFACFQLISEHLITILREFGFQSSRISIVNIKARGSF